MAIIQGASPWIGTDYADDIRTRGRSGTVFAFGGSDEVVDRDPHGTFVQADLGDGNDLFLVYQGAGSFNTKPSVNVDGGAGDDTIYGTSGSDTLNGGIGDDNIFSLPKSTFLASSPKDYVHGGAGNDVILADGQVFGDEGNDTLRAIGYGILQGSGYFLDGGAGNDILDAGGRIGSKVTLIGGAGADVFVANGGNISDFNFYQGDRIDAPFSVSSISSKFEKEPGHIWLYDIGGDHQIIFYTNDYGEAVRFSGLPRGLDLHAMTADWFV